MAKQYFKIAGKTRMFVELDDDTNRVQVIVRDELIAQRNELQTRIGTPDPNIPKTNAEWIAWAKANYSYIDHTAEQAELDKVLALIDAIKAL